MEFTASGGECEVVASLVQAPEAASRAGSINASTSTVPALT